MGGACRGDQQASLQVRAVDGWGVQVTWPGQVRSEAWVCPALKQLTGPFVHRSALRCGLWMRLGVSAGVGSCSRRAWAA